MLVLLARGGWLLYAGPWVHYRGALHACNRLRFMLLGGRQGRLAAWGSTGEAGCLGVDRGGWLLGGRQGRLAALGDCSLC